MADVIFSGTDGRRAINIAEVSMTFAEVDPKTLSLPGVNLDFTEVTITRRVYRDGNGEYLHQQNPLPPPRHPARCSWTRASAVRATR